MGPPRHRFPRSLEEAGRFWLGPREQSVLIDAALVCAFLVRTNYLWQRVARPLAPLLPL